MIRAIAWGAVIWMLGAVAWLGVARADIGAPIAAWKGDVGNTDLIDTWIAPRRDQALQSMIHGYLTRAGYPTPPVTVCHTTDAAMDRYMPRNTVAYAGTKCIVIRESAAVTQWPPAGEDLQVRFHEALHYLHEVPGYGLLSPRDQDIAERVIQAAVEDLWPRAALAWWPNQLRPRLSLSEFYGVAWVRAASASVVGGPWWGRDARVWRRALVLEDAVGRNRMLAEVGL